MTPPCRRWSFSLRCAVIAAALAAVTLVGYGVHRIDYEVRVVVRDSYAQWWAADMVIEYMMENHGRWPRNWEELRDPHEAIAKQAGKPWTLAEIRDRVEIRFDADPQALRSAALVDYQPPFEVVYLRSGEHHNWKGKEPNRMIWDYLHDSSATQADRP